MPLSSSLRPTRKPGLVGQWLWLCVAAMFLLTVAASAQAAKRVAFVVGNAKYENEKPLTNPHHDATLIADVLARDLKFDEVIRRTDLDRRQLADLVGEIGRRASGADAVFVYFSGHGMQGPDGNYLIPVDARISEEDHVRREGVNARDIVTVLRAANPRVAVLVLDACRDSPYSRRTKSVAKGLSRMNVSGNLLVAYATAEGSTADDGRPGNSPYALALAQHLKDGNQAVLALFDAVRRTTLQMTGGRQSPTREGDLEVSVYLISPFAPVRPDDRQRIEEEAWALCSRAGTALPCQHYLNGWPQGQYARRAHAKLKELDGLTGVSPAVRPGQNGPNQSLELDDYLFRGTR